MNQIIKSLFAVILLSATLFGQALSQICVQNENSCKQVECFNQFCDGRTAVKIARFQCKCRYNHKKNRNGVCIYSTSPECTNNGGGNLNDRAVVNQRPSISPPLLNSRPLNSQPLTTNLNNGLSTFNNGVNGLNNGLANGVNTATNGLNNLNNGLNRGLNGLGASNLNNGVNQAATNLGNNLNRGVNGVGTTFNRGLNNLNSGLNGAANNVNNGLNGAANNLNNGVRSNLNGGLVNGLNRGANGLTTNFNRGVNGLNTNLNRGVNGLNSNLNGLNGNLNRGLNGNLNRGLNGNLNRGLNGNLNRGVNNGLNSNLNGLNTNLNRGVNNGLNSNLNGLNTNLNRGVNNGLNSNLNGLNTNLNRGINGLNSNLNGLNTNLNRGGGNGGFNSNLNRGGVNGVNSNRLNRLNGLNPASNGRLNSGGLNGLNGAGLNAGPNGLTFNNGIATAGIDPAVLNSLSATERARINQLLSPNGDGDVSTLKRNMLLSRALTQAQIQRDQAMQNIQGSLGVGSGRETGIVNSGGIGNTGIGQNTRGQGRLFQAQSGINNYADHMLTIYDPEVSKAARTMGNYTMEGPIGRIAPTADSIPGCPYTKELMRFYNGWNRDHFYTVRPDEEELAKSKSYKREGSTGFCVPDMPLCEAVVPLYRFWRRKGADHIYTTKREDILKLLDDPEWVSEGVECYIWPNF